MSDGEIGADGVDFPHNFIHTKRSGGWGRQFGADGAMEHRGEPRPMDWSTALRLAAAAATVAGAGADRAAAAAREVEGQDRLRVRTKGAQRRRGGGADRAAAGRRGH